MNSQARNTFFSANSIKNIPRSTSYSAQLPSQKTVQHELNPKAFVHREVFNNKIYQTNTNVGSICTHGKKFFNIAISKK